MRFAALATDYDGTIAHDGRVSPVCVQALDRLRQTGRRLILVTGRELPDLLKVLPETHLFDRVVAENGALLYTPTTKEQKLLGEPPPRRFVTALRQRGVAPLAVGRAIVATWSPHEAAIAQTIHDLGLDLQIILNKGAVMILPPGISKATGLLAALKEMSLSSDQVVGVGDAENDHDFLQICGCAVAVANALPRLKEQADLVTHSDHGEGVIELIEELISNDLARFQGCV